MRLALKRLESSLIEVKHSADVYEEIKLAYQEKRDEEDKKIKIFELEKQSAKDRMLKD